jgi:hypothetical protein
MGDNYYDEDEDEDDEDYFLGVRWNRYDDSDYDKTLFDFDVDETSEDDVVTLRSPWCMVSRSIRRFLGLFWRNLVMGVIFWEILGCRDEFLNVEC